ncbi:MAG: hypothetical protein ABW104_10265 [Candidatus Thiodiazotropha sp. 6PLUC2]
MQSYIYKTDNRENHQFKVLLSATVLGKMAEWPRIPDALEEDVLSRY